MNVSRSQPPTRSGELNGFTLPAATLVLHRVMAAAQLPRNPLQTHPHALRRNISATSSGVFITCPLVQSTTSLPCFVPRSFTLSSSVQGERNSSGAEEAASMALERQS